MVPLSRGISEKYVFWEENDRSIVLVKERALTGKVKALSYSSLFSNEHAITGIESPLKIVQYTFLAYLVSFQRSRG